MRDIDITDAKFVRLHRSARFICACCNKEKISKIHAECEELGNKIWICNACYGTLVQRNREKQNPIKKTPSPKEEKQKKEQKNNYPKVTGTKSLNSHKISTYRHALECVRDIILRKSQDSEGEQVTYVFAVKGLFKQIKRENCESWKEIDKRFGHIPAEELPDLVARLNKLGHAFRMHDPMKITECIEQLVDTKIMLYISKFLESTNDSENAVQNGTKSNHETPELSTTPTDVLIKSKPATVQTNTVARPKEVPLSDSPKPQTIPVLEQQRHFSPSKQQESENITIWLYTGRNPCRAHSEMIESVTAEVYTARDQNLHLINVNYCKKCRKYYMDSISFNLYAKKYGMPLIDVAIVPQQTTGTFEVKNDESVLHTLGYNVNAIDNIPVYQRHLILSEAMDAGIVSKHEVVSFLELLIKRNQYRSNYDNALAKWRTDLKYVLEYQVNRQRRIRGQFKRI